MAYEPLGGALNALNFQRAERDSLSELFPFSQSVQGEVSERLREKLWELHFAPARVEALSSPQVIDRQNPPPPTPTATEHASSNDNNNNDNDNNDNNSNTNNNEYQ